MNHHISLSNHTAATLLGAALSDLIPQGYLLKGGVEGSSFYYDIVLGETLDKVMLPHLENRMKEIASKDFEIKVHEMVPSNAYEFFKHHRRYYPSHFVQMSNEPLVKVVQIDAFIDYVEESFLENTGELGEFRLEKIEERPPLNFKKQEKHVYRVYGKLDEAGTSSINPLEVGQELGLFDARASRGKDFLEKMEIVWRGLGESVLFGFYQKWREIHIKHGYELVVGGRLKEGRFAEFFFEKGRMHDFASMISVEKDLIESIKKCMEMIETLSPLGGSWSGEGPDEYDQIFNELAVSRAPKKEFSLKRKGSFLKVRKKGEFYTIEHSVFPSMMQTIIDVLEDSEKDLSQKKELLGIVTVCDELG